MAALSNVINTFSVDRGDFLNSSVNTTNSLQFTPLVSGNNDIYTVPTGKRAFVTSLGINNNSGGSLTYYVQVKISGTYYQITTASAVANNAFGTFQINNSAGIVLNAGEGLAVNASGNGGAVFKVNYREFDASIPFKTASLTAPAAGNNTVYTVPTGYAAVMGSGAETGGVTFGGYANFSGANKTYTHNDVLSGGSVGTTNQTVTSSTSTNNTVSNFLFPNIMSAGDFANFNTSANNAGQFVWLNMYEFPL